ncbi:FadR/GntR family transcriptional regulator [Dactylosporangium sucinum]|uniref:GntR family transcriptional regulator n=1 Tax=Dactylosporangium sucinum TaxID=1424081 RepID=A0A917UEL4_9ACTN|nr:FCD domain-containing protein [Dactylosporangium sucinum]GGM83241.1 GntR family transcriptional regulator [Dactylosporangium sucinum]
MTTNSAGLKRVRKAYEQIADQLRDNILRAELRAGERLPRETDLAETFGVSRATVREALRVLASENLIRTSKGATGGSFVMRPTIDYVSEFMTTQINLLTAAEEVSIAETVELRELIEVEATRLGALRRTEEQLARLTETVPGPASGLSHTEVSDLNRAFHLTLLELAHNRLMVISAQPVYAVLEARSERSLLNSREHDDILREHAEILACIRAQDGPGAAEAMREHLVHLRPLSERTWRKAVPRT